MLRTLNVAGSLIPLDETSARYRAIRKRYFVAIMRLHPDVWQVHKDNYQFKLLEGVICREAVKHCAVQAARARVIGRLLGLGLPMRFLLEKAAFLHDSYKAEEIRYLRRGHEDDWEAYDEAQRRARRSWESTDFFGGLVMDIAGSVAHESLLAMVLLCEKAEQSGVSWLIQEDIAKLAMHYLDDIAVNDKWATAAVDGRNVIDVRTDRNAANPNYEQINERGRTALRMELLDGKVYFGDGRTTYEEQCRVGHMVEDLLAKIIMMCLGITFDPRDLPVILDNVIRKELIELMNVA